MAQQKALFLLEKQGAFAVRNTDVPKPGPGELLIEIHSTGLNPVDWKIAKTGFAITEYPAVLGLDEAGVVKEAGEGVTSFQAGDKVIHLGRYTNRETTFQQYTIAPADLVVKLPTNLSFDEGATIPAAIVTAVFGLYSKLAAAPEHGGAGLTPYWAEGGRGKYANQPILIIGGSSAVGQQAIQVARLSGFSPIITTASLHNTTFLQSLGATHVLDRSLPLAPAIQSVTSTPITVIYDAISLPETQAPAWDVLAAKGTLVLTLSLAIDAEKLEDGRKNAGKEVVQVYGTVHDQNQRDLALGLYARLTGAYESGDLKPNNVEVLPDGLAGIPDGLDKLRLNKVSAAKLIARPQETV